MNNLYPQYRQPRDDIKQRYYDPTRPTVTDCTFLHKAIHNSRCKRSVKAKKCDRLPLTKRFMNASERAGKRYLLPAFSPLWNWLTGRFFPSYQLRQQYQLGARDLSAMHLDDLLELMRLGLSAGDKELSRSVAKELECRAYRG